MGNPLSPIMAELFMAKFEMKLKEENKLPRVFLRYVDDCYAVVTSHQLDTFLNSLNSQCESIKFTFETEKNGKLPFLDLELTRINNKIDIGVYHKSTSTKRVITSDSHCPIQHKHASFHSMIHRLINLPLSLHNFKKEYDYICDVARLNGYSKTLVDSLVEKHSKKYNQNQHSTMFQNNTMSEDMKRVGFSYVPGVINKIKNRLKKHNILPVFSNSLKLKNIFESTKDKIDCLKKSGIYSIECGDCNRRYIGQTKRSIEKRSKEHFNCVKQLKRRESAIAEHAISNKHTTDEKELKLSLIKCVSNDNKLDAYESYFIEKESDAINLEPGNIQSILFSLV